MMVLIFLEKERASASKWKFLVFSGKLYLDTTQDGCLLQTADIKIEELNNFSYMIWVKLQNYKLQNSDVLCHKKV